MGWVVKATTRPIYPQERPGTHCIGGWLCLRSGLDRCGKSRPRPGFDPRTIESVTNRYTDWAIPAHRNWMISRGIISFSRRTLLHGVKVGRERQHVNFVRRWVSSLFLRKPMPRCIMLRHIEQACCFLLSGWQRRQPRRLSNKILLYMTHWTSGIGEIFCFFFSGLKVKVKVKGTLVQALRLRTGRTAHSGSRGIALLYRHWGSVQAVQPIGE